MDLGIALAWDDCSEDVPSCTGEDVGRNSLELHQLVLQELLDPLLTAVWSLAMSVRRQV